MRYIKSALLVSVLLTFLALLSIPILYLLKEPIISTYNKARPLILSGGGGQCIEKLKAKNVIFTKLGDIGTSECPRLNAVRIKGFQNTKISSPFTLSCPTANAVALWLDDIQAKSIKHMGTLNCRKRRGRSIYSEHSFGTAIDISHIDGASVKSDWGKSDEYGLILANATKAACKYFNNVLTPDSNRLHHDHYHLDTGIGLGCHLNNLTKLIFKAVRVTRNSFNGN